MVSAHVLTCIRVRDDDLKGADLDLFQTKDRQVEFQREMTLFDAAG